MAYLVRSSVACYGGGSMPTFLLQAFKMHNKFLYLTGLCDNTLFRYIKENTKSLATHQTTEQDTVLHLTANNDGLKALKGIGCKDVLEHLMFPTKILQFVDFFLFFKLYLSTVSHHTKCSPREQCVTLFKQRKKYTQIKYQYTRENAVKWDIS